MMQAEARPAIGEAIRPASASRRPIRIVAPTASGRRWRTARRAGEPSTVARATVLDPTHFAVLLSAGAPR